MPYFALPPLALYVHIPWCVRKCPYCDFNSHALPETMPEQSYVSSLLADLEHDAGAAQGRKLQSIFFGGGTPSLFTANSIEAVLNAADQRIGLATDAEITLEANPGTVEQQRFADFRRAGVNRLSIGIQSLHDHQLQALGRIHSREDALRAVETARRAGFDNFNLDLMHGLPQQSLTEALTDLTQLVALGPAHISWYQLTIERNTAFYSNPPVLPNADVLADIEDAGEQLLRDAGYRQYEVSAYSRAGRRCRHNYNYWEFGDYLGIGAGAHGKITQADDGTIWRSHKTRLPAHYIANTPLDNHWSRIPRADLPLEFMMNCLRLNAGVPAEYYPSRTGLELDALTSCLNRLRDEQLLCQDPGRLAATPRGRRFLNDVLASFMEMSGS
ncbi:MAG: radical SAM family heme chaperone HemW [Cellvibrionaceae bacterium]